MDHQDLYFFIIAIFAVIQSIFGMGILVFGTPTLLLFGFDFSTVLALLLPSSVLISLTQVLTSGHVPFIKREKKNLLLCAIFVLVSLSLILALGLKINIDILVGIVLLFSAAVRLSDRFRSYIKHGLSRYERSFVIFMGVIHGMTNMGGALLALYASATQDEKQGIRATVSCYYLVFGLIQLTTLSLLKWDALNFYGFMAAPLALIVYLVVGNIIFRKTSSQAYERLVTFFITVYGVVVLTKGYL
ncbi:TSUP family transporter [Dickeya dianthicola]|uniref:TSUP family transporter n=1 Tax=Dickeya dianthicola TaxID=204039 RepID=UPI001F622DB5|nr:TSUP family transporter [Dickeya dianthicola]MCI4187183.1 TSUP family transporter [Dickeya dianthicola]